MMSLALCAAVLLTPDTEICTEKDDLLYSLSVEDWNRLVCSQVEDFDLGQHRFVRDPQSFNLLSLNELGDCQWEIRAPKGAN